MARTLDSLVADLELPLSAEELVDEFAAVLRSAAHPEAAPLTESEALFLRRHGGPEAADALAAWDPREARADHARATVRAVAELVETTLGVTEAADALGVDRSRISHRLAGGTLWAVSMGRHRRIPRWQITDEGQLLPGLATVIAALPPGIDPLTVDAFMHTALAELGDQAPVGYLAAGGDPDLVAGFLADLGRW
jgi:excisionase family DNA binding protein